MDQLNRTSKEGKVLLDGHSHMENKQPATERKKQTLRKIFTSSSPSFYLFVSFYAWLYNSMYVLNEVEAFVYSGIWC